MNRIAQIVVASVALSATPALAWNDRPPEDGELQGRDTWTFDFPAEQPLPFDDTTYATAAPNSVSESPGLVVGIVPQPLGDGRPGDVEEVVAVAPAPSGASATMVATRSAAPEPGRK